MVEPDLSADESSYSVWQPANGGDCAGWRGGWGESPRNRYRMPLPGIRRRLRGRRLK